MKNPPDHKGILSRSISPSPSRHYLDGGTHNIRRTIFIFSLIKLKHFNIANLLPVSLVVFLSLSTIRKESGSLFVVFYFDCSAIGSLCGWFPLVTEIDLGLDVMAKVIQCTLLLPSFILLLSAKV